MESLGYITQYEQVHLVIICVLCYYIFSSYTRVRERTRKKKEKNGKEAPFTYIIPKGEAIGYRSKHFKLTGQWQEETYSVLVTGQDMQRTPVR